MTKDEEPLSITAAAPLIRTGELTPSELLEQCLRRIDIYEPAVKAWVYLDRERARRDAAMATEQIRAGNYLGELHGIPIGIKDIIDVFDMPTGCGSKLWANSYARKDATCVERLRRAGAIILGKTVTTPYAFTDPPITRNPWNLERTPGGSSSGSAAAVACGMCLAALGTQTGGSLTRPASYCGVCSLKPSYGRVSVEGVLPLAPSLDHVGVIAGCVRDLAVVFEVISGPHNESGIGIGSCCPTPDSMSHLGEQWSDLWRKTTPPDLCFIRGMFDELAVPFIRTQIDQLADRLHSESAFCTRIAQPPSFASVLAMHCTIMAVEAAEYHSERLKALPSEYPPKIRALIEDGLAVSAVEYRRCRVARDQVDFEINSVMNSTRLIACSATTSLPPDLSTTGDPWFNSPWSFTGHPTVSVPYFWTEDGLPMAVQFVASDQEEANLLSAGVWAESVFNLPRRLPPVPK